MLKLIFEQSLRDVRTAIKTVSLILKLSAAFVTKFGQHTTLKNARNIASVSKAKSAQFQYNFQVLNARAARVDIISNVHQIFKQKCSCYMRETAVKRISFFVHFQLPIFQRPIILIQTLRKCCNLDYKASFGTFKAKVDR